MTVPVFVDTNVFVYARDASEPSKQPIAIEWLDHLWRDQSGRTSIQVLSEYYVTVTRKLSPGLHADDAWDDVETLLSWRPAETNSALLRRGREVEQRYRLSWWDSLIVAAAQLQACAVLLSEDMQDGATYGAVTVRSPFSLRVAEEASAYRQVRPTNQHRKRGRPKKAKQQRG
jgi:predicted nucleic acid-binding protein